MADQNLSLYVHIPFCATKCGYCHFNTFEGLERLFAPYTLALCAEIERYAQALRNDWLIRSIFIGGGTPTHLPAEHFMRVVQTLRAQWQWAADVEITAEANPSYITPSYLECIRASGVNRLSFGAQAFDADLLRMLDREHSVEQIGEAVQMARCAGFTNLNLDLMYGLPNQTLAQWERSLDAAIALQPEHLSLYALTIDEGTAFKKRVEKKLLPELDPDLAADMYLLAEAKLASAAYEQYEISNWAKATTDGRRKTEAKAPTFVLGPPSSVHVCHHNLTYWLNEPYLGFGPGAHSFFNHERFWNLNAPQIYIERIERGESVIGGRERINARLEQAETVILALRLNEGIARARFGQRFGAELDDVFGATLKQCAEWELLADDGERVRLTQRGRLLANEVFQRLLPD